MKVLLNTNCLDLKVVHPRCVSSNNNNNNNNNIIVFSLNTTLFLKDKNICMFLLVKVAIRKIQR